MELVSVVLQFWIGYTFDAGYVAANTGQWHIDFNASCPAPAEGATGSVTWNFNYGEVTGTVDFKASNNTGGTLDVINTANSLADRMKAIAARISNQP